MSVMTRGIPQGAAQRYLARVKVSNVPVAESIARKYLGTTKTAEEVKEEKTAATDLNEAIVEYVIEKCAGKTNDEIMDTINSIGQKLIVESEFDGDLNKIKTYIDNCLVEEN